MSGAACRLTSDSRAKLSTNSGRRSRALSPSPVDRGWSFSGQCKQTEIISNINLDERTQRQATQNNEKLEEFEVLAHYQMIFGTRTFDSKSVHIPRQYRQQCHYCLNKRKRQLARGEESVLVFRSEGPRSNNEVVYTLTRDRLMGVVTPLLL
ncbi:hypothetical protein PoB_005549000 [Plakobranchus ocellatus]|uniref:Uncharacterized protein n=1 Tax=Plakobranchus ocellatus TaxID=259542 RepID=A0AAV4CBF2_9GAST|nr:hypothetical protein PoB_005549000 [Plakobranchus ocellatus]